MANYNPRIDNLKPIRETKRAKELGRLGGIASGITRKRKSIIKERMNKYIILSDFINRLNESEYKGFIKEFSEEEQKRIKCLFKSKIKITKKGFKVIEK